MTDFFDLQRKQLDRYVAGLILTKKADAYPTHDEQLDKLRCAFENLLTGYEATATRLDTAAAQLEGDACKHPASLIMGREETGGRRFPIVWCPECGAIKFDSHMEILPGTPEAQWMLPEREKATAGRLI